MNLPQWLVDEYTALIERHLSQWKTHAEYDDIRGTAQLVFWRALARLPQEARYRAHALAVVNARHAVHTFLSSPACLGRNRNHRGQKLPVPLSLDALEERRERDDPCAPFAVPYTEDFAPALVEWLWQQDVCRSLEACLEPAEWEILAAWLLKGRSLRSLALAKSEPVMSFHRQAHRLAARCREMIDAL